MEQTSGVCFAYVWQVGKVGSIEVAREVFVKAAAVGTGLMFFR